jgi:hypothetical protein
MRPDLAACLAFALLAGCASLPAARTTQAQAPPVEENIQTIQLNSLLAALVKVVSGTPAEQAEEMALARTRIGDSRQGPGALRYGLLLAAPGHPGRDPAQGQQMLREALARPELLSVNERALGMVELERVSVELRETAEKQRLALELQQERERQRSGVSSATLTRQLQAANDQIAQLRKDLADARDKLNAIAELERRQADRPPAGETRNP